LKKSQLKQIKTDLENAEKEVEEVDTSEIVSYNKKLKKHETEYESLVQNREVFAQAALMLKDGGIKTRIIQQYVPVMNKLINKYLGAFDLFVDFQLDENFNEVIKSRFRDTFSYASFSEGEKLRINLAILLTWRAVSTLRNSISTNLLIMDEVLDGAADSQGVDSLIEILNSLATNDNVFVISHRGDQFGDKFESHIRFEKVKNFSQISL
jgi:DNA repair exonuclease SbcCD ATPase subunit